MQSCPGTAYRPEGVADSDRELRTVVADGGSGSGIACRCCSSNVRATARPLIAQWSTARCDNAEGRRLTDSDGLIRRLRLDGRSFIRRRSSRRGTAARDEQDERSGSESANERANESPVLVAKKNKHRMTRFPRIKREITVPVAHHSRWCEMMHVVKNRMVHK